MNLKAHYKLGDTVEEVATKDRGVVILITKNSLCVKYRESTVNYNLIVDFDLFKEDIKILGNINYTLRYTD
jgi:hypothetical protein